MTSPRPTRRYRKSSDRSVWVFSELNHRLTPEQVAKILVAAGFDRARQEALARAVEKSKEMGAPDA